MGILLMTGALSVSPEGTSMEGSFLVYVVTCLGSFTTTFELMAMVVELFCAVWLDGGGGDTFLPEPIDLFTLIVTLSVGLMMGLPSGDFAGRMTGVLLEGRLEGCTGFEGAFTGGGCCFCVSAGLGVSAGLPCSVGLASEAGLLLGGGAPNPPKSMASRSFSKFPRLRSA